jgi:hypothetical protein
MARSLFSFNETICLGNEKLKENAAAVAILVGELQQDKIVSKKIGYDVNI